MSWVLLSYVICEDTPAYGGGESLRVDQLKSIQAGDSCNTQLWRFHNHLGTHIDAPRHFSNNGLTIDHYPPEFWICNNPYFIELPAIGEKAILGIDKFKNIDLPENTEILLIKTGFGKIRTDKSYIYCSPGLDPDLSEYFRSKMPKLKVIGLDMISISSYSNRELGRLSHKAFLVNERPILLIEDMDLSRLNYNSKLKTVIISPLLVKNADAAPCTVFCKTI